MSKRTDTPAAVRGAMGQRERPTEDGGGIRFEPLPDPFKGDWLEVDYDILRIMGEPEPPV